jgi:N-acetylmuramoyl-L-alanine amidase
MGRGLYQAFVAFKNKQKGDGNAPKVTPDEDQRGKASKSKRRKVSEEEDNNLSLQQDEAELAVRESENNNGVATAPVFKVQILASDKKLKPTDRRLKRRKGVDVYKEGAVWKYTVGASTDYNKIYRLRKQLLSSFPTAFIIAFQDGEKVDVNDAIRVFKKKKVKSKKK